MIWLSVKVLQIGLVYGYRKYQQTKRAPVQGALFFCFSNKPVLFCMVRKEKSFLSGLIMSS
ncbi:hypothetical protein BTO10_15320 [Vibrio chagasii]|uniref:Uncharacterized protein n=1 Tax=Vibrio chagasii TaxID=170679 RepID=A0A2S7VF36_9VIBR|nr:hypothetical protein BTO10_15320 [Vibrio chagasii]